MGVIITYILLIVAIVCAAFAIFSSTNYIFRLGNRLLSKLLEFDISISGKTLGTIAHIFETIVIPISISLYIIFALMGV